MNSRNSSTHYAFLGTRLLAKGALPDIARAAAQAQISPQQEALLVFDSECRPVDLDLRGTPDEAAARAADTVANATGTAAATGAAAAAAPPSPPTRGRGRPQLGVVAREVTLLPRHWEWLAAQPGGASVTLRRLVEEARRRVGENPVRLAQERAYRFLTAIGGNLPDYERALRALFGRDAQGFTEALASWPEDIRSHAHAFAAGAFDSPEQP